MESFIYYLTIFGIFLSVILLINSAKGNRTIIYLGIFYLLLSLNILGSYILLYSKSVLLCNIFITNFDFTRYLLGPFAYFYIRNTLTDNSKFHSKDLWHFLLSAVVLITLLPHIISTIDHKTFITSEIIADRTYLASYKPSIIYAAIGVKGVYLLRPIQTLIYVLLGLIMYLKNLKRGNATIFQSQRKTINWWLGIFIFFLFVVCLTQFSIFEKTGANEDDFRELSAMVMLYICMTSIIGLLITPFIFPGILYGLPLLKHQSYLIRFNSPEEEAQVERMDITTKKRSSKHHLEDIYLRSIEQKIEHCMAEEKPFLQNNFNLSNLSSMTNTPLHHLSYYFREVRKETFTEMKNEYRVNYAVKLMESGELNHFTLETIGIQSGFETRNTFRTAFKRVYGITPSEFVDQKKHIR